MKTKMNRLALASTAILAATIALQSQSQAQAAPTTADLNFDGTVPSVCTFSNPVTGKVAISRTVTKDLGTNINRYSTGAAAATVDLACTGAAVLTVADPVQLTGATTTTSNAAAVYTTIGSLSSPSGGFAKTTNLAAGFQQTGVRVDVDSAATTPLLGGSYSYKVVLTATPN